MVSFEEWPRRRDRDQDRSSSSSSHRRRSYPRTDGERKSGSLHEERRSLRRSYDHEPEHFDRRKSYDQKRQADLFSGLRTDFPKGFRSERDRSRREGGGSWSWWRSSKDLAGDGMQKSPLIYSDSADRRSLAASHDEQRGKLRSRGSSSGDQSRNLEANSTKLSKRRSVQVPSSSSEMEEGELEPDPETEAEQPCSNTKITATVESDSCEVKDAQSDVVEELDLSLALPSSLTTKSDGFGITQNSSKVEDHLIGNRFTFGSVDSVSSAATCQAHTSKNSMKNGSDPPFQSVLLKQFVLDGISCLNQEHLACIPGRNTGLISGRNDELERVIKFKQAEAKMYQERADSARKEALDLRHIAMEKSRNMDEDCASRIEESRLVQLEERRGEKLKELQSMEMAHREYCNTKLRMEVGIEDLLLKMEATRRNLNFR